MLGRKDVRQRGRKKHKGHFSPFVVDWIHDLPRSCATYTHNEYPQKPMTP